MSSMELEVKILNINKEELINKIKTIINLQQKNGLD